MDNLSRYEVNSKTTAYHLPGEKPTGFISLEYEITFLPSTENARMIYEMYKEHLSGEPCRDSLLNAIRKDLREKHSFEIDDEEDGKGLEIHLPPATLSAHKILYSRYSLLLKELESLGFTASLTYAGIHSNIDYSVFGDTVKEQYNCIEFFIEWVFYNKKFIIAYSKREFESTKYSDMYVMLNDPFGLLTEHQLKERLHTSLSQFRKSFESKKPTLTCFNISLSKSNRRSLEVRWFNSTLNPTHIFSILEFFPAFVSFYNSRLRSFSLKDFCSHVKSNISTYPNLLQDLLANPHSYRYSIIGVNNLENNAAKNGLKGQH